MEESYFNIQCCFYGGHLVPLYDSNVYSHNTSLSTNNQNSMKHLVSKGFLFLLPDTQEEATGATASTNLTVCHTCVYVYFELLNRICGCPQNLQLQVWLATFHRRGMSLPVGFFLKMQPIFPSLV